MLLLPASFLLLTHRLTAQQTPDWEKLYWQQREGELKDEVHPELRRYGGNWPCPWGEAFMGGANDQEDGGTVEGYYTCGHRYLPDPCVVYSFGCNNSFLFEDALRSHDVRCEIHIFDFGPKVPDENIMASQTATYHVHSVGLSDHDGLEKLLVDDILTEVPVRRLSTLMEELGHKRIDILKLDIEGSEHRVLRQLAADGWPDVRQLLMEAHVGPDFSIGGETYGAKDLLLLLTSAEGAGLRLFHSDPNWRWGPRCCVTFSLVQGRPVQDQTRVESKPRSLVPELQVPHMFSCSPEGGFEPGWTDFKNLLASRSQLSSRGINAEADGVLDDKLRNMSFDLLEPFLDTQKKEGINIFSAFGAFRAYLSNTEGNVEAQAYMSRVLKGWGYPGRFCLPGIIAALLFAFRSTGNRKLLRLSWLLLGELQDMDILLLSGWPLSTWDLICHGALNEPSEEHEQSLAEALQGSRDPAALAALSRLPEVVGRCGPPADPPVVYKDFLWSREPGSSQACLLASGQARKALPVAVVGHHATLSLELYNSLQHSVTAQSSKQPDLECHFFGQFYPEEPPLASEPLLKAVYQRWFAKWAEGPEAFGSAADTLAGEVLGVMEGLAVSDLRLGSAKIVLCHYPASLCMLLRDAMPTAPIIHLYDSQAFRASPRPWLQWSVRGRLKRLALHSSLDVVFTTSPSVSAQIEYISGIRLPAVSPLALYFDAPYVPRGPRDGCHVMLFRTHSFWQTSPGATLLLFLKHFLEANEDKGIPLQLVPLPEHRVEAKDFTSSDAVVFVPEDLVKMSFWELYYAAVPLFVPSRHYASMILPHLDGQGRGFGALNGARGGEGMLPHFFDPQSKLPHWKHRETQQQEEMDSDWLPPFDIRALHDGHRKVHQWSALADFWNFPAVQHFDSASDLIRAIWAADLDEVSFAMSRHHSRNLRSASAGFYACALQHLLGTNSLGHRSSERCVGAVDMTLSTARGLVET